MKRRIGLSSLGGWVLNGHHVESAVTSSFSVNAVDSKLYRVNKEIDESNVDLNNLGYVNQVGNVKKMGKISKNETEMIQFVPSMTSNGYKSSAFNYDPVSPLLAALTKRGDLNSAKCILDDAVGYLRMYGMQALSDLKVSGGKDKPEGGKEMKVGNIGKTLSATNNAGRDHSTSDDDQSFDNYSDVSLGDINHGDNRDINPINHGGINSGDINYVDINYEDISYEDPKLRLCVALDGLTPVFEMVGVKVGGSVYQVPRPVSLIRGRHKAVSWLVNAAYNQVQGSGRGFYRVGDALGNEVLSVVEDLHLLRNNAKGEEGNVAVKSVSLSKKLALYRLAKANRNYVSMLFGGQIAMDKESAE